VSELNITFRDPAANPTHADVKFFRQWLTHHILHDDTALAAHLRGLPHGDSLRSQKKQ
jgi:hypothetical protein